MILTSGQGRPAFPAPPGWITGTIQLPWWRYRLKNAELARLRAQRYKRKLAVRLRANPPPILTHERLIQVIHYDPATGMFTRIGLSGDRVDLVGKNAGGPTSDGYFRIAVDNRRYRAHRLAWFYMTGAWPTHEIDHRNRVRSDTRWDNLREATSAVNKQNRNTISKNIVGLLGVSLAPAGKFKARIDRIHIGVFDTPEQAHAAYVAEKRTRHEGFIK